MAPFSWSKRSVRAAQLVAEGKLTGTSIAADVGLSRQGLDRWKTHPDFTARVAAILDEYRELLRRDRVARWERRLDETERWVAARRAEKAARRRRSPAR